MNPVTGPYERTGGNSGPFVGSYVSYRKWYRQKRPYSLPLPCVSYGYKTVSGNMLEDWYASPGWAYNPYWMYAGFNGTNAVTPLQALQQDVASECRERFNSRLREKAEIGVALAEARQSISMIEKRAMQLYRFTKALKRFDFLRAGAEIGLNMRRSKNGRFYDSKGKDISHEFNLRDSSHAFADNFLEFWFGWAPLVSDIGAAAHVLSNPFMGVEKIRAKSKSTGTYYNAINTFYPWAPVIDSASHEFSAIVKCQANVTVSNPNLSLATQLGLTNPAAIAWELVPFSFVVDYFVNVGSFLESYDSLFGVNLDSVQSSTLLKDSCHSHQSWWDNRAERNCHSEYYYFERTNSLPQVTLRLQKFNLSLGRALSSISLLIQNGIGKR